MSEPLPPWDPAWSDGCSVPAWLKPLFPETPAVRACCERHDGKYYKGGTKKQRLLADIALLVEWLDTGDVTVEQAEAGFNAVRAGGGPEWRVRRVSWAFGGERFVYDER